MTTQESKEIAGTILMQLGGRKFIAMTGANNFTCDGAKMMCKIGRNAGKVTHIAISLNGLDLYDMKFFNCRGANVKIVAERNNVYNDQLQSIFTQITGMYTSL